jgi:2-(1,2-epoxy-1,2-dihydrophenyl)acetyl-CoA isomerase
MTEQAVANVVLVEVKEGVAWIRLNRPDKMNAVSGDLRRQLLAALKQCERDENVRCLVVTGSGRAFCAGADLGEFGTREGSLEAIREEYHGILTRLRTMPKPVIAAMNGVAAGIGASIAMACDVRYAAPSASFVEAFVKIGLTVDGGATWLLPRLIGTGKAFEMFYTGDPLGAEDAERLGLVNKVLPADQLEAAAGELAARLARGPVAAMGAIKRSVNRSQEVGFDEALDYEFHLQAAQMMNSDFSEGVTAFLEKRSPKFGGRA